MQTTVHNSIEEIDPRQWNALQGTDVPFLRHEFLAALEHTGCVGGDTGWAPQYIALRDSAGLLGAVPGFLKWHSYGEFVFDFAWAQAYARYGERYYPKLALTIPFTPATGARWLMRAGAENGMSALVAAVEATIREQELSSGHALFLDEAGRVAAERAGWLLRRDCQFQWRNRGYRTFDDYLESFTSVKRKKARRERRRVSEGGIRFETRYGGELDRATLDAVYALHRDTFLRHGHEPYLTRAFFAEIARTLENSWLVKLALAGSDIVAAAVFFESKQTLYGRYWGAAADFHSLHFETCYHQGIEHCIERGLEIFDPGVQGEHKVSRGFEPALTWSAHFIADARFRAAIAEYLLAEAQGVNRYAEEIREHLPFRAAE
jgi:predicted N-acyltransferase